MRLATVVLMLMTAAAPAGAAESRTPLVGVNGFATLIRLEPGDSGDDVVALQEALADAGFFHSAVDGAYGRTTESAVVAFHKYLGLERTTVFNALDWIRLELLPDPGLPERYDESDYLEVDLERQLLFLVEDGELAQVIPVSTGGGYTYISPRTGRPATADTPPGDHVLRWHQLGWVCDSVTGWCVYKYCHSPTTTASTATTSSAYLASHGCIRVETWDADSARTHLAGACPPCGGSHRSPSAAGTTDTGAGTRTSSRGLASFRRAQIAPPRRAVLAPAPRPRPSTTR
jgi:hypothetical protein